MSVLYVDNFRGFSKTVIPLKPVNFFIGENSTGKTSILALINLLSSQEFWLSQDFNRDEYEFGGFRDILSAHLSSKNEFYFGFCITLVHSETKSEKKYCYLISYKEKEGLPTVSSFARLDGPELIVLKLVRGKFVYKRKTFRKKFTKLTENQIFNFLRDEHKKNLEEFKSLPKRVSRYANILMIISMIDCDSKNKKPIFDDFLSSIPVFSPSIVWFAPIRSRPKRTYDGYGHTFSPEGEHTPYLIRKELMGKAGESFRKAIDSFGKESGLFNKVIIKSFSDDAEAPFELLVEISQKCSLRINSVGYGVSQALPIIAEILNRPSSTQFAIQQPEIHLHPKAQASIGDFIYHASENEDKRFFIETHSDFTIDRFRLNLRKNINHKTKAQVLFFKRGKLGNNVSVIPINSKGDYSDDQPVDFREFFLKEQMDLLGL